MDYVLWWLREGRLPPALTTSSPASRGLLGLPDTQTLYGDDRLETRHGDRFNGLRFTLDYWFGEERNIGIEGRAFFLERDSTHFKAQSDGSTLLAIPFFNPDGSPGSDIIAGQTAAGLKSGGYVGYSRIELFGEEANCVARLLDMGSFHLLGLAGARFLQMRDRTDLTAAGHLLPAQTTLFGLEDHFRTANAYYGGQVGLREVLDLGPWSLNLGGDIGLGGNAEQVRAFGQQILQTPTQRIVTPTGLFVQQSNTGTFNHTDLNMVAEANLNVGYRVCKHMQLIVGYTFLLWDGVLRAGDQIDQVINPNGTRPAIPFKEDLFWAQGVNAGAVFSW
jgi:hypothetical protein